MFKEFTGRFNEQRWYIKKSVRKDFYPDRHFLPTLGIHKIIHYVVHFTWQIKLKIGIIFLINSAKDGFRKIDVRLEKYLGSFTLAGFLARDISASTSQHSNRDSDDVGPWHQRIWEVKLKLIFLIARHFINRASPLHYLRLYYPIRSTSSLYYFPELPKHWLL